MTQSMQHWVAWSQIVSTVAVVLSMLLAMTAIIYNVVTARKIQTATFLYESRFDKEYLAGTQTLWKTHHSGRSFRCYIFPNQEMTERDKQERQSIIYCLNFYERLAVSISNGIYHEAMIKEVFYNSIVNYFYIAEPFIKALREKEQKETYYQEYEWLAKKWKREPLMVKLAN